MVALMSGSDVSRLGLILRTLLAVVVATVVYLVISFILMGVGSAIHALAPIIFGGAAHFFAAIWAGWAGVMGGLWTCERLLKAYSTRVIGAFYIALALFTGIGQLVFVGFKFSEIQIYAWVIATIVVAVGAMAARHPRIAQPL